MAFTMVALGSACGGKKGTTPPVYVGDGGLRVLGSAHTGQYNLGPVEWTGSFSNACAPYPPSIETLEGGLLAGLSDTVAGDGSYCDACVWVQTDMGKQAVLRVITYGVSKAAGDMDLSQAGYDALSSGEYPRSMTWSLVQCPTTAPLWVQFQTQANPYWTSLWVRNPEEGVQTVEVQSAKHATWFSLSRGTDGTFTDASGFGTGAFTLRVTGVDGAQVTAAFPGFSGGDLLQASGNLP